MYTKRMTTRTLPLTATLTSQHETIDWSGTAMNISDQDVRTLLSSIKDHPNRRNLHIFLGAARHRPLGRRLQNTLQAMGCLVTNKLVASPA